MTDDENPYADRPDGKVAQVRYSIANLWSEFGNVDNIQLGIVINVGLGLLGLPVVWFGLNAMPGTAGLVVAFIGAVWAIVNILPVVQWMVGF